MHDRSSPHTKPWHIRTHIKEHGMDQLTLICNRKHARAHRNAKRLDVAACPRVVFRDDSGGGGGGGVGSQKPRVARFTLPEGRDVGAAWCGCTEDPPDGMCSSLQSWCRGGSGGGGGCGVGSREPRVAGLMPPQGRDAGAAWCGGTRGPPDGMCSSLQSWKAYRAACWVRRMRGA